jgi:N-acetylmuramoyl-L-alanine amidase
MESNDRLSSSPAGPDDSFQSFSVPPRADEEEPSAQPRRRSAAPRPAQFSPWKSLQSVLSMALLVATLFTMWTPANLFSNNLMERMFDAMGRDAQAAQPQVLPTASPRPRIGLVAGHWGNDSGAVCQDGLTEVSLNLKIATMVKELLEGEGYEVDLLKEFDSRLPEYQAVALVSIHNDSCEYFNDQATGYKVAAAPSSIYPEKATRLTACISQRYKAITGMQFHYNTITRDMKEYHAFSEIHSDTTAAIIETGFMNLDREMLTNRTDLVARGVASGVLCFVRNEDIPNVPTSMP